MTVSEWLASKQYRAGPPSRFARLPQRRPERARRPRGGTLHEIRPIPPSAASAPGRGEKHHPETCLRGRCPHDAGRLPHPRRIRIHLTVPAAGTGITRKVREGRDLVPRPRNRRVRVRALRTPAACTTPIRVRRWEALWCLLSRRLSAAHARGAGEGGQRLGDAPRWCCVTRTVRPRCDRAGIAKAASRRPSRSSSPRTSFGARRAVSRTGPPARFRLRPAEKFPAVAWRRSAGMSTGLGPRTPRGCRKCAASGLKALQGTLAASGPRRRELRTSSRCGIPFEHVPDPAQRPSPAARRTC